MLNLMEEYKNGIDTTKIFSKSLHLEFIFIVWYIKPVKHILCALNYDSLYSQIQYFSLTKCNTRESK